MIRFDETHLELSLPVARALIAFACADTSRQHLGIGIRDGALCATDGHVLLRFERGFGYEFDSCGTRLIGRLDGKLWGRAYLETAVKVARAHKAKTVRLPYSDMLADSVMPPCGQVIPSAGFEPEGAVAFNPAYVALIALVCKACEVEGAHLSGLRGALDPMRFEVRGSEYKATAVVMPMRL